VVSAMYGFVQLMINIAVIGCFYASANTQIVVAIVILGTLAITYLLLKRYLLAQFQISQAQQNS
jgi:hypothetical protein